jgi:metallo-beta-lactamase family protein
MKIYFNGAAQTVTGSQHLLEVNGHRLLLDCGLFQGKRSDTYKKNREFAYDPAEVDAVLLSHAHIDHSGNIPNLVKNGFHGPIYATDGTCALAKIMLRDSGHIQEADVRYVNKKRRKKNLPPMEPLYTIEDAEQAVDLFQPVEYNEQVEVAPGVVAHYVEAGHILGSAGIVLDIEEKGRKLRLWFSGDIGRLKLPLLRDPVLPENADYLLMESTYGDKTHRDPEDAYIEFRDAVKRTVARGGKIIIPSFAVGRTQELVYDLNRMVTEKEIPHIPVYVDSPLAVNASDVFRQFSRYFDEETREFVEAGNHPALSFKNLTYTRSVEESKAINYRDGSMVIISASGMAETGRILHHLKNNIEDPKNTVLIVSWQAPHTLGRRLAEREKDIRIFGEKYKVKAEVVTIGGLSAHAGQDMLLKYAAASADTLKHIFLVHGEPRGAMPLMEKIQSTGFKAITFPERGQVVEI